MIRCRSVCTALAAAAVFCTWQAHAWGPSTSVALADTAARIIAKDMGVQLTTHGPHIRNGASVSDTTIDELIPGSQTSPLAAVESEMLLLQSLKGTRVDPYFAYRLGVLGKLVSRVSAPLATADPAYRNRYYSDVDADSGVPLTPSARMVVEVPVYFPRIQREATAREELILKDYRDGVGFKGVASQAVAEDVSRTVNAIADVWYTVLKGQAVIADLPKERVRDYLVDGIRFYVDRKNLTEMGILYSKLEELNLRSPDILKQIGDMFYDAEEFARAIEEYENVLTLEPHRKDVAARISEYYVRLGKEALDSERLADARQSFARAVDANRTDETAQTLLRQTEKAITDRETRLEQARQQIVSAEDLEKQSERLVFEQQFSQAQQLLQDAEKMLLTVDKEFQKEHSDARVALNRVADRMAQIKRHLTDNAGSLSGSGVTSDAAVEAEAALRQRGEQILRKAIEEQYRAKLNALHLSERDRIGFRE